MLKTITEGTAANDDIPVFFFSSHLLRIYYSYRNLKLFFQSHGRWVTLKFSIQKKLALYKLTEPELTQTVEFL